MAASIAVERGRAKEDGRGGGGRWFGGDARDAGTIPLKMPLAPSGTKGSAVHVTPAVFFFLP